MKRSHGIFIRSLTAIGIVVPGLLMSTPARAQGAQAQARAAAAYNAYNAAFLVQLNGQAYYADTLTSVGIQPQAEWGGALAITVAEDAYQHTHNQADRNLVISLLNNLAYFNGPGSLFGNWQTDGWDDNLAWMVNAFLRGYQLTGVSTYLIEAEAGWNNGYNQGWDTTVAGGGIWENTDKGSKCALSNDPFVFEGVQLYQATGDSTYLTKAETIYSWVRSTLFVSSSSSNVPGAPGQIHGCVDNKGMLQSTTDDNVYDSGAFLTAANDLYRVTGNQSYYNDALLAADHIVNEGPILHSDYEAPGNQWAYWFTFGLSQFATDANLWPEYHAWLLGNANAAWRERNSLNLTWNNWVGPTNDAGTDAMEMSSAAAIWQHLPPASVKLSGTYEIQNVASNLALSVSDGSSADNATLIQSPFSESAPDQRWTFEPTSGGYCQIRNVNSGLVVNVSGASAISGAGIVQSPAQGMIPGSDQWLPALNPEDGTYSFYNLNSLQALEDPAESSTSGTQLDQWFGNSTTAQKFFLVRLSK
jgi:hypothetical protein